MHFHYPKYQRGQFLILVAASMVVLVGFAGLAIDSGRGYGVKAKLNAAVDAASVAAARALAEGATEDLRKAAAQTAAQNYYAANFPDYYLGASRGALTFNAEHQDSGRWVVDVAGSASMPVTFMGILGFNNVAVTATGQTIRRDLDIILVLDTSGSLASPSSAFPALQAAAVNFVNKFNAGTNGDRVGLVSFASGGVVDVPIVKDGTRGFNRPQVVTAINALTVTGGTASAEGMRLALNEINGVPTNRSSLRMIVFFSDGAPNAVPATFTRTSGTTVTGDLYSETASPGTTSANRVYRYDRRDIQLGTYSIATLPTDSGSSLPVTGVGPIPLASYNNKRTLTGAPYTNTRCNVNKAARNMVENVANTARSQTIKIYSIALGAAVNTPEITFCSYGTNEYGSSILSRLANTVGTDTYNAAQPSGLYVWAANASDLDTAFSTIASEILRLSQ